MAFKSDNVLDSISLVVLYLVHFAIRVIRSITLEVKRPLMLQELERQSHTKLKKMILSLICTENA